MKRRQRKAKKLKRQTRDISRSRNNPSFITAAFLIAIVAMMVGSMLGIPGKQFNVMSEEDVVAELRFLDGINAYPSNKVINPAHYPKQLGIYSKNGQTLTEVYHCSDVCPDYGRVIMIFENVTEHECHLAGGRELLDPSWGSYVACVPSIDLYSVLG